MSIGRFWESVAILLLCAVGAGCQAGADVESTVATTESTSDRVTPTSALPSPSVTASASVERELGAEGFTVAVVGDWYADDPDEGRHVEDAEQTRDAILAAAPALVLGLGDFSYDDSPDSFFAFAAPLEATIPIYPTYGNHDGISKGEVTRPRFYRELRDHFVIHDEWYSFDVGPVHFISINSEYPFGTAEFDLQFEDISADLAAAYADDDVRMIIPFFHRAMVNPLSQNGPDWTLQEIVHPLLDGYSLKIPLALQGHHHIYTRTHAVDYSDDRDTDRCQDTVGGTICEMHHCCLRGYWGFSRGLRANWDRFCDRGNGWRVPDRSHAERAVHGDSDRAVVCHGHRCGGWNIRIPPPRSGRGCSIDRG